MSNPESYLSYIDRFGLMQISPGTPAPTSDNGALVTLEYFLCLSETEKKINVLAFKKALRNLEERTQHGSVTRRFPGCSYTDSMDNATALLMFSELFDDSRLSKELYKHGELTRAKRIDSYQDEDRSLRYYPIAWVLNGFSTPRRFYNVRPNDWSIQSWWGRSPGFMGLLELSALDRTSLFRYFALWVGQFLSLLDPKQETSGKKLTYIVWQWLKTRNKFWRASYRLWCFLLTLRHKNGMKDVYRIYYGDQHPITKSTLEFIA